MSETCIYVSLRHFILKMYKCISNIQIVNLSSYLHISKIKFKDRNLISILTNGMLGN